MARSWKTADSRAVPFARQEKAAVRRILRHYQDHPELKPDVTVALTIYLALTMVASDAGSDRFEASKDAIALLSGTVNRTVQRMLPILEAMKLIQVNRPGGNAASTIELFNADLEPLLLPFGDSKPADTFYHNGDSQSPLAFSDMHPNGDSQSPFTFCPNGDSQSPLLEHKVPTQKPQPQDVVETPSLHNGDSQSPLSIEEKERKKERGSARVCARKNHAAGAAPPPPQLEVFKQVTGRKAPKGLELRIIEAIGDATADDIRPYFQQWVSKGFNPQNISGWLFDWFTMAQKKQAVAADDSESTTRIQAGPCPQDAIAAFDAIQIVLKGKLSKQQYNDWIRPSHVVDAEGNILRVAVPNERFRIHWQKYYVPEICQQLEQAQSKYRAITVVAGRIAQ